MVGAGGRPPQDQTSTTLNAPWTASSDMEQRQIPEPGLWVPAVAQTEAVSALESGGEGSLRDPLLGPGKRLGPKGSGYRAGALAISLGIFTVTGEGAWTPTPTSSFLPGTVRTPGWEQPRALVPVCKPLGNTLTALVLLFLGHTQSSLLAKQSGVTLGRTREITRDAKG